MPRSPASAPRRPAGVRLASLAGAFAFTAATLAAVVGGMGAGADAGATEVAIVPSTIEVVGTRAPTRLSDEAKPHVG